MSVTHMSDYFTLAEWKLYIVPDGNEAEWRPNPDPEPIRDPQTHRVAQSRPERAFHPIGKRKWIYVFQQQGIEVRWYGEYFIDDHREILSVDMNGARDRERTQRPDPVPAPAGERNRLRLPHTINGQKVYYYFLASRIRLSLEIIHQLGDQAPELLPAVDLEDPAVFIRRPGSEPYYPEYLSQQTDPDNRVLELVLPITDPVTIATNLSRAYRNARDSLLGYTTVFDGQRDDQKKETEIRIKKKLIAEMLKAVLEDDPEDRLDLRNAFGPGKKTQMLRFLGDYKASVERKIRATNRAADPLCHWLSGRLMIIIEESYKASERMDFHLYLKHYAGWVGRINECPPGQAFLAGAIASPSHFIHKYVLRESPASDEVFAVAREAYLAIVAVWEEIAPVFIRLRGRSHGTRAVRDALAQGLNHVTRQTLLELLDNTHAVYPSPPTLGRHRVNVNAHTLQINQRASPPGSLDHLRIGVDLVNLALATSAVIEADDDLETAANFLGALGSLADTIEGIGVVMRMPQMTLKTVGFVSAAFGIFEAGLNWDRMAARNDYSAMAGHGLVAVGSGLTAVGSYLAIAGAAGALETGGLSLALAIIGGIMSAAGWIIAVFTEDADILTFVKHCFWGKYYGEGTEARPWMGGPLSAWRSDEDPRIGLGRQVNALLNILAAFSIETPFSNRGVLQAPPIMEPWEAHVPWITIRMGFTQPTSRYRVEFSTAVHIRSRAPESIPDVQHHAQLYLDCGNGTARTADGSDPVELSLVCFREDEDRCCIDVRVWWPFGQRPQLPADTESWSVSSDCTVRFDMYGNGSHLIPRSGPVPYSIMSHGQHNTGQVNSKDFG